MTRTDRFYRPNTVFPEAYLNIFSWSFNNNRRVLYITGLKGVPDSVVFVTIKR